jgi:hypothetical protein
MLLAVILFAVWLHGRRRRPERVAVADPYATLAATQEPVEGVEVEGAGGRGAEPD